MNIASMLVGAAVMFAVTYLCKGLTRLCFRTNIKNTFVKSFLYYLPYSVLAVMVFPVILFSTSSIWSGIAGTAVALLLAYFRKGLLVVALSSIATVFVVELAMMLLG